MSSGQNCAGCERVLIQASVFDASLAKLVAGARSLRQQAPLEGDPTAVDAGALALPGLAQTIAGLVDDAVMHGANVMPNFLSWHSYYTPPPPGVFP